MLDAYVTGIRESELGRLRNSQASSDYMFLKSGLDMKLLTDAKSDPDTLNATLREALRCHHQYFATMQPDPVEDQSNDPLGFPAPGPLAFASLVASRGWTITVESDYLPRSALAA